MHAHAAPPSPWPFFLPIGIAVIFVGLGTFSAAFITAGLVMTVMALLGWYRDAGHEWRTTDAGDDPAIETGSGSDSHTSTAPFPGWMLGVYGIIFLMATLITVGGWSVDSTAAAVRANASAAAAASAAPGVPGSLAVVAQNIQYTTKQLTAKAGAPFDLTFENRDKIPHNVAIYASPSDSTGVFRGDIVTGPTTVTYHIPALKTGTYEFRCDVHPTSMTGTFVVD